MISDLTKKGIMEFIEEESVRLCYGKLFIQLNVVSGEIVDMEVETKKRKHFNSKEK